jgi:hypothetical protein
MRFGRACAITLAALLTLFAISLACIVVGWIWLNRDSATPTPVAVEPTLFATTTATSTHAPPTAALSPAPDPTATPSPSDPSATPTFAPSPAPTPTSPPLATPTPLAVVDPSLTDRAALERQFREAQADQEMVLLVHDDHLEREIAAYLATQPEAGYRNVTVRFRPGLVELGGDVEAVGLWIPATVRGVVTVQSCVPEATITELEVGGFLTPRWVRDYVANLVYDALDRYPDDLAVCLTAVTVGEGEATVEGVKR